MFCPACGKPYIIQEPDADGIRDCFHCGVWTLPVYWQVRNDVNYAKV